MKLLATTGLMLLASVPFAGGLGKGIVDDRPGAAQARKGGGGGKSAVAERRGARAPYKGPISKKLPVGVQVKSLKCLDAQEPFGDEIELRIAGKTLWGGVSMTEGSIRPLTYLKPFPLDEPMEVSLWEDDPSLLGWFGDDHLGSETLEELEPGTYTTTFHGNGGAYELTFEVMRPDRDRLASRDRLGGGRAERARGSERMRRSGTAPRSSGDRHRRPGTADDAI